MKKALIALTLALAILCCAAAACAEGDVKRDQLKVGLRMNVPGKTGAQPGTILGLTKTGLQIACGEGAVEIRSLQAEGGKRMAAPDYFRGHPLEA